MAEDDEVEDEDDWGGGVDGDEEMGEADMDEGDDDELLAMSWPASSVLSWALDSPDLASLSFNDTKHTKISHLVA